MLPGRGGYNSVVIVGVNIMFVCVSTLTLSKLRG